jgi:hypothetical protein
MANIFTEIKRAFDFGVRKSTAKVRNEEWRIIRLMRETYQAGKSIQIFTDGFRWLLSDLGQLVNAHLEGIGMTKVLDEESPSMTPVEGQGVLLPELEINKLGELIQQIKSPRRLWVARAKHGSFKTREKFIRIAE